MRLGLNIENKHLGGLWIFKLPAKEDLSIWNLLYKKEKVRADAFKNLLAKKEYIYARLLSRFLIRTYRDSLSEEITYNYNSYNKPSSEGIEFNISHSDGLLAIVLHPSSVLGIDIQKEKKIPNLDRISKNVFNQEELVLLDEEPDDYKKLQVFFNLWTRKEALMKALGIGFSRNPRQYSVLSTSFKKGDCSEVFKFHSFDVLPSYQGCVVTQDFIDELMPVYRYEIEV